LSLRQFLKMLESDGELIRLKRPFSTRFEIARLLKKHDKGKAIVVEKVAESELSVVGNVLSKRNRLLKAVNCVDYKELYSKLLNACNSPVKTRVKDDAPFLEIRLKSLKELPILTHFEKDGGPYITAGIVVARDPESDFQNASFHRLMLLDDKRMAIRIVPRHLFRIDLKYERMNRDTPIAIFIGAHPAVLLSAASSPAYGVNELHVANKLMEGSLDTSLLPETGLEVPRHSEIVLEGRILRGVKAKEGPFVDIVGLYDIVREQPVVEIDRIYVREKAYYQALLPAGSEHMILMGFHREAQIWEYVSKIADVKAVKLTEGGGGWLHCIISIRKMTEGDAKNVIMAAFAAHPSLKTIVVVDEDIDIEDPVDVEWALATRFQADRGIVIIKGARGSSLDPSADQVRMLTTKMGIDATVPLDRPRDLFTKARIPG